MHSSFSPDEFDEILFACTIHHLDDERLLCLLKELHYCMKPDGVIHVFDLVRQEKDGWSQNSCAGLTRENTRGLSRKSSH